MRSQITLISLLCICFMAQAQEYALGSLGEKADCGIALEGNNIIKMPKASFSSADATWTYPFPLFPIYSENQSISGNILCHDRLAGSEARVYISGFDIFDLLSDNLTMMDNQNMDNLTVVKSSSQIRLNSTGDGRFALEGAPSGLYTIKAVDDLNSTVIATTPALIAKGEIAMDFPSRIKAGDILQLDIETPSAWGNVSKIFGAIMVYGQDYETAKINLTANDTVDSLQTTIAIGDKSMQVNGMPRVSTELLMNLLTILPQNSAIAMQESTSEKVELYLFTDPALSKGEYVLTCAVYAPGSGLMGLRQGTVEVE